MGLLATLLANGVFSGTGSALLGGLTSMFGSFGQNKAQRRMMEEQQRFNADEAEKQRAWQQMMNQENNQFSAKQAELARQFQEDFYNKYQSPSAMMAQYQEAGINPMLVAGQGAGSPPSVSSASASSAPGGAAASSGLGSSAPLALVDAITSFMKIKAEIDNINADTKSKLSQSGYYDSQTELNGAIKGLTEAQTGKVEHEINLLIKQSATEEEKKNLLVIQKALELAKTKQINYSNAVSEAFEDYFGYAAPVETINALLSTTGKLVGDVVGNFSNFGVELLKGFFKGKKPKK